MEGSTISTFQGCLLCKSRTKGSQFNVLQKCKRPIVSQQCPSLISIFSAVGKFSCEYPIPMPLLINLINRDWDKIHSVCLIQHLIDATMDKTRSSRMRPTCSSNFNHASQGSRSSQLNKPHQPSGSTLETQVAFFSSFCIKFST